MICGYAEILKHAVIKDQKFFEWLMINTKYIFNKHSDKLVYAIKKVVILNYFLLTKMLMRKI